MSAFHCDECTKDTCYVPDDNLEEALIEASQKRSRATGGPVVASPSMRGEGGCDYVVQHADATPGCWHVLRSVDERRAYVIADGRVITDSAGCSVADAELIVDAVNRLKDLDGVY